jgi:phage shock protein C
MYCCNCGRKMEDEARYCSACGTARPSVQPAGEPKPRPPLSRVREGKRIAGVCGGVARYFDMDVTLVRIVWVLVTVFPPVPGLVAYLVCWVAMPQDPPASSVLSNPANAASQTI